MATIKTKFGNTLYISGLLGLPLGVGIALGYYAGAWGVRWMPTMLEVFLGICIASLLAIIAGRAITGDATRDTEKGKRLRKRVNVSMVFVSLVLLVRLGVYWAAQPSALTELSPDEFNSAFKINMENYFEYDSTLAQHIDLLEDYSKEFGADKSRVLTEGEEKLFRDIWVSIYDCAFALEQINSFYEDWYRFDPSQVEGNFHQRSFLLAFAAELSLYEKSTHFIKLVCEYENAVKFLNTPHKKTFLESNSFSRFREEFQGVRDHGRIIAGKQYLLWMELGLKGRSVARDYGCLELWEKVESELSLIDEIDSLELASLTAISDTELLKRNVGRVWFNGQRGVAKWMGNTRVKRIGKYLISKKQRNQMQEKLEPGDILLSRKNWYLSNVGLPGFWPHAILYLGNPTKLDEYFDDDLVLAHIEELTGEEMSFAKYLEKEFPAKWLAYKSGNDGSDYCVIEGLSPGVVFNTMKGTCGDYMAALRPVLSKKAKAQAIVKSFSHQGKPYDYNFDFATDHALVCTELVWRVYRPTKTQNGLRIPLIEVACRKTLPANEIAKLFSAQEEEKTQLEFVYFLDANEKKQKAFFSTKEEFVKSCKRDKWSFSQE